MATESPIRILETTGKWPSPEEAMTFRRPSTNMAVEELELLLRGQSFQGNGRHAVPNRSGSAPPSMEGSVAAIENILSQQNFTPNASLNNAIDGCESEQFRADPAYLAFYGSNVNLNRRLPPSLISSENRRMIRHIGSVGNNWRLTSFDDSGNGSLRLSRSNLPTHEEESEDDRSPQLAPDDWVDRGSGFWPGQGAALSDQHKSVFDLIQEDFPRTPSPVYNQSSSLSHESVEEALDYDAGSSSLHDPSFNMSNAITPAPGADAIVLSSYTDLPTAPVSSSSSLGNSGGTCDTSPLHRGNSNTMGICLEDEVLTNVTDSDVTCLESEMKAISMSSISNSENHKNQKDQQHSHQGNMLPQQVCQQQTNIFQLQGAQSQMISQGISHGSMSTNQFMHGPSNMSAAELQPILQSSGFTPPLYAAAAAYMASSNTFYPNLQPSGYFPPQYGLGGYALNPAALPPFLAGYPSHSTIPVAFDGAAGPSFSTRTSGGSTSHGIDMHLNKFYGQVGFSMQPSFADPLHMQYFQQPFGDACGVPAQFDHLASRDGASGNHINAIDSQKGTKLAVPSAVQKLQHQGSGGQSHLNPRREGITSPYYFGSTANMGILMQYPTSPVASPVMPGSPVGGTRFPRGRNDMRFLPGSGRNAGMYSSWPGQRGLETFDDTKTYSFLEELKSGKGRRFELSDIAGRIVEFSADQHGSRFIQQKLENCCFEEKASVFKEVLPHASKLITDVFGNYVIQKFFEYGSPEQRKELANQLEGQVLPLSLQMYGCRVIQKALDVIELEQKTKLVCELDGHIMRCVRDQNGNHVIQKCIESMPTDKIEFIISSFRGHVAILSTHPYGCRVIQRVLEHCTDELQSQFIVDEILESVCALAQDQYGNYVTQHVLERGKPHERDQIISKLSGRIVQLSQHKFASNVIEKCLEHGDFAMREILIGEIIGHADGNDNLLAMMKDQYANYVVQKILQTCTDNQREMLLGRIRIHLNALKKYTYGKHIVARFEQLYGEEIQALGS